MTAWTITRKELSILLRDRRALVVLLALPLSFISILGFSTGQMLRREGSSRVLRLAVLDQSRDPLGAEFVAALQRRQGLAVEVTENLAAAREQVQNGDLAAVLTIGPRFRSQVDEVSILDLVDRQRGPLSRGVTQLDLRVEQSRMMDAGGAVLSDLVFGLALETIAPHVARRNQMLNNMLAKRAARLDGESAADEESTSGGAASHDSGTAPLPANALGRLQNEADAVYQILIPAYTVMFTFFLVNIMARSFLIERDQGTLRRLRLAPISAGSILLGKTIPFLILSILQSAVLFLAGRFIFGMSWGPTPVWLVAVIVCTSSAATTMGLLTATLVRTESQVSAYATFIVLTMAGISGCFMPRAWLPPVMQQISLVTPHAWALTAYDQLLARDTPSFPLLVRSCGVLLAFSALFFEIGRRRFKTFS